MRKIKLLELDITVIRKEFTAYSAGIWQKTLSIPQAVQDASPIVTIFGGTWDDMGIDPLAIGSVRVNNTILGSVDSIEELREQDGAFYFDVASQIIYLALFDYKPAWFYNSYKTGETTGFINKAQMQMINGDLFPVDSYLGANYYEPRLIDDIDVSESVDDQTNGIFIFDDISASINNADGAYDSIRDNVTGNECRVLMANLSDSPEEEIATGFPYKTKAVSTDFSVVREGIIDDVDYSDPNRPTINAIDRRSDWTQTISTNLMTIEDYPDIESTNQDDRKPLLIGVINGSKCIRLEPKPSGSSSVDFLICDTYTEAGGISSVTNIYFDGKISGSDVDRYLTSGEYAVNTTTGVLTVYNYNSGNAYFYGVVTELSETVEIILFLLNEYANLAYIPSNFNKNEIEQIKALDYKSHVYVDAGGEDLYSVIEKLVLDIQIDFFQQGSALTMRLGNEERGSSENIPIEQITDNPAPWVNDRTNTVKTISVSYNYDYRLAAYETYYDATNEQDAIDNNLKAVDKTFETNLTTLTDVQTIYDEYYTRFTAPSRTVTVNRLIPFSAGLTDFVTFKVARQSLGTEKNVFTRAKYKIVEIDQDNNTAQIVYFSDSPEPYYTPGNIAFLNLAYQAPSRPIITNTYQGNPAFYENLAGLKVASITGITTRSVALGGSGILAGIPQQIGE